MVNNVFTVSATSSLVTTTFNGYVGIGTTNPTTNLEVNGNIYLNTTVNKSGTGGIVFNPSFNNYNNALSIGNLGSKFLLVGGFYLGGTDRSLSAVNGDFPLTIGSSGTEVDLNITGSNYLFGTMSSALNSNITMSPSGTGFVVVNSKVGINSSTTNADLTVTSNTTTFANTGIVLNSSGSTANPGGWRIVEGTPGNYDGYLMFIKNGNSVPGNFAIDTVGNAYAPTGLQVGDTYSFGSISSGALAYYMPYNGANKGEISFRGLTNQVPTFNFQGFYHNGSWNATDVLTLTASSSGNTLYMNGNVGIGTTAPDVKLDVVGTIKFGSATEGRLISDGTNAYLDAFKSGGGLIFRTNIDYERMRITTAGNVGIGTTTPDTNLAVSGNIHSTGQILGRGTLNYALPDFSFSGQADMGIGYKTSNSFGMITSGIERMRILGGGAVANVWLPQDLSALQFGASQDASIKRLGANKLGIGGTGSTASYDGTLLLTYLGIDSSTPNYNLTVSGTAFISGETILATTTISSSTITTLNVTTCNGCGGGVSLSADNIWTGHNTFPNVTFVTNTFLNFGGDLTSTTGRGFLDFDNEIFVLKKVLPNQTSSQRRSLTDPDTILTTSLVTNWNAVYSDDTSRMLVFQTGANGNIILRASTFGLSASTNYDLVNRSQQVITGPNLSATGNFVRGAITLKGYHLALIGSSTLVNSGVFRWTTSSPDVNIASSTSWNTSTLTASLITSTSFIVGVQGDNVWVVVSSTTLCPYAFGTDKSLTENAGACITPTPYLNNTICLTQQRTRVNENAMYIAQCTSAPFVLKYNFDGTYMTGTPGRFVTGPMQVDFFTTRYSTYIMGDGHSSNLQRQANF
jgi:hypothetical protein